MMGARRKFGPVALALVLAVSMIGAAGATPGERVELEQPAPWERDDPPEGSVFADDLWFVEFAGEPEARGGVPSAQANERAQLHAQADQQGVDFTVRNDFGSLWNGLSVAIDRSQVGALRQLDSVQAVYPVGIIEQPDPEQAAPDLVAALGMTGADAVQSELGYTGEGLSVAIIDTGIDYNHPDLGGDGDPGTVIEADSDTREMDHPRITHGWDYVGEGFDASDPDSPDPDPNPDPMDPNGHGTHVAGIVGAADAEDPDRDQAATGVAPGVTFGAYKVFDAGSTTSDVILAALEDADDDGMDIVNMSLGASLQWGQDYPTTAASNELAADGVAVVNSAGNDAALGAWSLSAPANAHDIISVASADNVELLANVFEVEQLDDQVPWLEIPDGPPPPTEGESDPLMALGGPEEPERFGCFEDDFADFEAGHVALISRGGEPDPCTFEAKYDNAASAGATGVLIYNNVPGLFAGGGIVPDDPWVAGISDGDGAALLGELDDEEVTLEFTDEQEQVPSPTGGLVSSFSSYGQDLELEFGPSVMAPGGLITSTYPLELGEYAMLSGTSMSAPHVAGAVALLWEADGSSGLDREDRDPLALRDRLQNTAEPAMWSLAPGLGFLDHSFRQGAGMIQIDQAIEADQSVSPGQISLGDATGTVTQTVTLSNDGDESVTYSFGHEPTMATGWSTFAPGFPVGFDEDTEEFFLFPASIVDPPEQIEVEAGGSVDVAVTIAPPFGSFDVLPNHQFGGYLTWTAEDGQDLRVPYAGFDGDYQRMPLFGYFNAAGAFVEQEPWLSRLDRRGGLEQVRAGTGFNVRAGNFPVIEAFFGHSPQQVTVTAIEHRTGEEHTVEVFEHHPRSPDPDFRWPFVWDGTVIVGEEDGEPVREFAPSGSYTLRLDALRALGDPDIDEHVETWESPRFNISSADSRPSHPRGGPGGGPGNGGPGGGPSEGGPGNGNGGNGNGGNGNAR